MRKSVVVAVILLLIPVMTHADVKNTPLSVVTRGLDAYLSGGPRQAIESWVKGSALEGSKEVMSQANVLRQVEDFYGKYEGYEVVDNHRISKRVHMILFIMNYTRGPLFARIQAYRSTSGEWVATDFKFHTEASVIWPSASIYGK